MPRKKTAKSLPIEVYDFGDVVLEIYADGQLPKGRGLHKKYAKYQTFHNALETLLEAKADLKRGVRKQHYFDLIRSARALAVEVRCRFGVAQSLEVTTRICRFALRTFAMATKEDQVRLPYQFDFQEK